MNKQLPQEFKIYIPDKYKKKAKQVANYLEYAFSERITNVKNACYFYFVFSRHPGNKIVTHQYKNKDYFKNKELPEVKIEDFINLKAFRCIRKDCVNWNENRFYNCGALNRPEEDCYNLNYRYFTLSKEEYIILSKEVKELSKLIKEQFQDSNKCEENEISKKCDKKDCVFFYKKDPIDCHMDGTSCLENNYKHYKPKENKRKVPKIGTRILGYTGSNWVMDILFDIIKNRPSPFIGVHGEYEKIVKYSSEYIDKSVDVIKEEDVITKDDL